MVQPTIALREVEAGGQDVQGHPQLYSQMQASLFHVKTYLKKSEGMNEIKKNKANKQKPTQDWRGRLGIR